MGTLNTTVFARNRNKVNTYIGGVSSTINTPALLASELGILENQITLFQLVGDDIQCSIKNDFIAPLSFFFPNTNITYFNSSKLTNLNTNSFRGCEKMESLDLVNVINLTGLYVLRVDFGNRAVINLPNMITCGDSAFYGETFQKEISFYIPKCTSLGSSVLNNSVFYLINPVSIIYAHPSLQTNNSGSPDGDLQYATSRGATVRYVSNFTAPNVVTDLTYGNTFDTAIELIFTPPYSLNGIDYYEVYSNGVYKSRIKASGDYAKNLTPSTSQNLQIIAVDNFFNKSELSNSAFVMTNATSYLNYINFAKYNLSDGTDSKGGYNGTVGASVSFVSGKNGNCAKFERIGTSASVISIPDDNAFSFGSGKKFSISVWFKLASLDNGQVILSKGNNSGTEKEWTFRYSVGLLFDMYDGTDNSKYIAIQHFTNTIATDVWYNAIITWDGSNTPSGLKIILNGNNLALKNNSILPFTGTKNTTLPVVMGNFANLPPSNVRLNGQLDEVYFFNDVLQKSEITYLQTNFL